MRAEVSQRLAEVMRLVSPPPASWRTPPIDWDAAATQIGTDFPEDYRMLIDTYGAGKMAGTWALTAPSTSVEFSGLVERANLHTRWAGVHGTPTLFPLHPTEGALLPWGTAYEGRFDVNWVMNDWDADRWPCVATRSEDSQLWYVGGSAAEALHALLTESTGFSEAPPVDLNEMFMPYG